MDDLRVRYLQMAQDLQEIADPPTTSDAEVAIELSTMANTASMYVSAVGDLLYLNDKITDPVNRGFARGMVRLRLRDYARQLDASIKSANRYLPLIKTPGVAQMAIRLRDELRKGSDLLKATVVK